MSEPRDLFGAVPSAGEVRGTDAPRVEVGADAEARRFAVDPQENVVLAASAGTGKTRVLVDRYLNLLRAGVDPANILAITFTRKAAAEMHERIVRQLREEAAQSVEGRRRWLALRDRIGEIAVSTIDAFCLSLLREFPLEAGLDPGFEVADETELPRLRDAALDRALSAAVARARVDEAVALVLAQLGTARAREGLAHLLERRLVAREALARCLARGPHGLTVAGVCARALARLARAFEGLEGGLDGFLTDGPAAHPRFVLLSATLRELPALVGAPPAAVRAALDRVRAYFLTREGRPRRAGLPQPCRAAHCRSPEAWRRHTDAVKRLAGPIHGAFVAFDRELQAVAARGVRTLYELAEREYRRVLDDLAVVDFSDLLDRALGLLRQMDEFAQSRFRLESRYHHVLVDEFQDTSRAQWELVALLVQSWGEGFGLVHDAPLAPSIFIVGDRKQSIYRFRDADVAVMDDAAAFIERLRPERPARVRRSLRQSLRAVPGLLAFVNDVFREIASDSASAPRRSDAFDYTPDDEFPVDHEGRGGPAPGEPVLGLAAMESDQACAEAVAGEIGRLLDTALVRDRDSRLTRGAQPGDVAILFRSRASHRFFEAALEARGIPAYVYQGLGFFDADEIKDLMALLRYLAEPTSDLRAAAWLRSRFVRLSDAGLARLAPDLAAALSDPAPPRAARDLDEEDARVLARSRASVREWLDRADRVPPADLLDQILDESAYAYELRGPRSAQAWANVKKLRAVVRRIQNRGYATLGRLARYLDSLRTGDESNAVIEATGAVNLMTVHAAKGLEFPIVFVVGLTRGVGGPPSPVRLTEDPDGEPRVVVGRALLEEEDEPARQAERTRDVEETKRLLYVAMTRARDRLYLAAALKQGRFRPGQGSLGSVMPGSLRAAFETAGRAPGDGMEWCAASGQRYAMRVCRPAATSGPSAQFRPAGTGAPGQNDFAPIGSEEASMRRTVTEIAEGLAAPEGAEAGATDGRDGAGRSKLVGRLVHRLFRLQVAAGDLTTAASAARSLVDPTERSATADLDAVVREAAGIHAGLLAREDVRALFASGRALFEVPFSLRREGCVIRGVIDAIVEHLDGRVTVVEIKTGRAHASHRAQLDLYVEAARACYRDRPVEGVVLYG